MRRPPYLPPPHEEGYHAANPARSIGNPAARRAARMSVLMHPWIVRNLFFPVHERLLGKQTRRYYRDLLQTQWWPPEKLRELQLRKLREQLAFAEREVPYFGRLFAEHGIRAAAIQDFDDFRRVPLMDKQTIRTHLTDLMPRNFRGRVVTVATGGSTGQPLQLYNDMFRIAHGDAARHRVFGWYGAGIGDPEVALWGSPADISKTDRARRVRDRLMNTRLLPAFGLDEAKMDAYIEFLREYRPVRMYAYVSCAYVMALRVLQTGALLSKRLRCMIVTAEPLYDFQRDVIEKAFRTHVSVEYGARDAGLMAGQCPLGGIHLNAELTYVEFGPPGTQTAEDGAGEVVVTNLDSRVVPIIRYRTGDLVVPGSASCECQRGLPTIQSIRGRSTDFLVGPDGKLVHALAAIYPIRVVQGIEQFRIHQDAPDHINVKLQTNATFDRAAMESIRTGIAKIFNGPVAVDVQLVDRIEPSASGKFRYVTSDVRSKLLEPPGRARATTIEDRPS